jgi:hypothetical protein
VSWAPEKVLVVETQCGVVPAAIAGVIVDDPPRRLELGDGVRKAAKHHHARSDGPSEPGEAARKADEKLAVL